MKDTSCLTKGTKGTVIVSRIFYVLAIWHLKTFIDRQSMLERDLCYYKFSH